MKSYVANSLENGQIAARATAARYPLNQALLGTFPRLLNNADFPNDNPFRQPVTAPNPVVVESLRFLKEKRARILDIGCELGRHALYLAAHGHQVVATDTHSENVALMQAAAKERNIPKQNLTFIEFDLTSTADKSSLLRRYDGFSSVVCTAVLHFLTEPEISPAIDALKKFTNPQGLNVLSAYTTDNPPEEASRGLKYLFEPDELATYYRDWTGSNGRLDHYSEGPAGLMARNSESALIPTTADLIATKQ